MSDKNGPRRGRTLNLRDLNGEDATARYKRLGWDPRKTYEENMGYEDLFIDDGSLEEPDLEPAPRRRKTSRAVRDLAAEGRGEIRKSPTSLQANWSSRKLCKPQSSWPP